MKGSSVDSAQPRKESMSLKTGHMSIQFSKFSKDKKNRKRKKGNWTYCPVKLEKVWHINSHTIKRKNIEITEEKEYQKQQGQRTAKINETPNQTLKNHSEYKAVGILKAHTTETHIHRHITFKLYQTKD